MNTIKLKAENEKRFNFILEGTLNITTLIALEGKLPEKTDFTNGRWWKLQESNKYELYPEYVNWIVFIEKKEVNEITLRFWVHPDANNPFYIQGALAAIKAAFPDECEIL